MSVQKEPEIAVDSELFMSILAEIIKPLTSEATIKALKREKHIRKRYGDQFRAVPPAKAKKNSSINGISKASNNKIQRTSIEGRPLYVSIRGKDIYGNEKPTEVRYFECLNCKRSVAGTRFAAHIERCFSGRNARTKGYQELDDEET